MNRYSFNDRDHLHTLDDRALTGTSSVTSIIGKPGLVYWASGMACEKFGWVNPRYHKKEHTLGVATERFEEIKAMTDEDYLALLNQAYTAHTKNLTSTAKEGKDLHSDLENYVKECIEKNEGKPMGALHSGIQKFVDWSMEHVDKFLWSEMHTYSEKLWTGGIVDAGALLKNGRVAIVDFKRSKAAYFNHFVQVGGYAVQLEETGGFTADGEKVHEPIKAEEHIVIPFGAEDFMPVRRLDTETHKESFIAALTLYRRNNEFLIE